MKQTNLTAVTEIEEELTEGNYVFAIGGTFAGAIATLEINVDTIGYVSLDDPYRAPEVGYFTLPACSVRFSLKNINADTDINVSLKSFLSS